MLAAATVPVFMWHLTYLNKKVEARNGPEDALQRGKRVEELMDARPDFMYAR